MLTNDEITIVNSKKAWYKILIAIVCYSIAGFVLWEGFDTLNTHTDVSVYEIVIGRTLMALIFIVPGTVFGMVREYHFDFKNRKYKTVKRIGVIGFGKWRSFRKLEYVSVHENVEGNFEVNLWYDSNKHFFINSFLNCDTAIQYSMQIAKQLKIEFHNGNTNQQFEIVDDIVRPILKEDRKIDAYFSQGNRPFWQTIVSGFCFTLSIVIAYLMFVGVNFHDIWISLPIETIGILTILISIGIKFSIINDYVFDLQNNQFKIIYNIGPIKWGSWKNLDTLDYISVFQKRESFYLINLWYNSNKHIVISGCGNYKDALVIGKKIATKLEIDLLDASDPYDKKWID
ncbi:hypothetical protein ACFQO1_01720 [Jejudonia soesokkakensis]|uniref:DUF304 domain-containing protein n=1 Tax=Jejudonia soesokkakensis TaxID=1323432 RepID=A0ABW2MUD8_9FLAO